jgi:hypothetical protein
VFVVSLCSDVVTESGARQTNQRTQTLSRHLLSGGLRLPKHPPPCATVVALPTGHDIFTSCVPPHAPFLITKIPLSQLATKLPFQLRIFCNKLCQTKAKENSFLASVRLPNVIYLFTLIQISFKALRSWNIQMIKRMI